MKRHDNSLINLALRLSKYFEATITMGTVNPHMSKGLLGIPPLSFYQGYLVPSQKPILFLFMSATKISQNFAGRN